MSYLHSENKTPLQLKLADQLRVLEQQKQLVQQTLELTKRLPDLHTVRINDFTEAYASDAIHDLATETEITALCGCCRDAAIVARRFALIDGVKVYATPLNFTIGHYYAFGTGVVETYMDAKGLRDMFNAFPECVQDAITTYLDDNTPYNDEEESDDEFLQFLDSGISFVRTPRNFTELPMEEQAVWREDHLNT